jgi:alpha-L-fucosidase
MVLAPEVTSRHLGLLQLIAERGDGPLFDLEVQELADLGMIYDDRGVLRLTRLGRSTARLMNELDAATVSSGGPWSSH